MGGGEGILERGRGGEVPSVPGAGSLSARQKLLHQHGQNILLLLLLQLLLFLIFLLGELHIVYHCQQFRCWVG